MFTVTQTRRFIFLVALAGMLVDGYLTVTHVNDTSTACGIGHGCDVVRASQWSELAGIPIAAFGLALYTVLALLMLAPHKQRFLLATLLTGAATAISAYLVYLQVAVIGAICTWCMASAILALLSFLLLSTSKKGPYV